MPLFVVLELSICDVIVSLKGSNGDGKLYVRIIGHLQVAVVVKAVWGIFIDTNGSLFTS